MLGATLVGSVAAAGPAAAKATVDITSVRPGTTVRAGTVVTFRGVGGDDSSPRYLQVCLEQRGAHRHWRQVACTPLEPGSTWSGDFALRARLRHCGHEHFRAQQYAVYRRHGHRHMDSASATVTVVVR